MGHFVKHTPEFVIDLNVDQSYFFICSKWEYSWKNSAGTTPWTEAEKMQFHNEADKLIWKNWSSKFKLKVKGTSDFAKAHGNNSFVVNFDIMKVSVMPHWAVEVTKIAPGGFKQSYIQWATRHISLDTEDITLVQRNRNGNHYGQHPVAHEYGHTIGNVPYWGLHGDEYAQSSSFFNDTSSIMNIGNQIRARHFDYLIRELNDAGDPLIPNTEFYV